MHKGEHIQHFCLSQQFCCPPSQADVDADVLLSGRGFAYVNMRMPELFPPRLSVHVCVCVFLCVHACVCLISNSQAHVNSGD